MSTARTSPRPARRSAVLAALGSLALTLTACGGATTEASTEPAAAGVTGDTVADTGTTADGLTVTDPWVKAADSGMTAMFGALTNPTDDDVTVVAARTSVAETAELHETVENAGATVMQEIDGGFVVPAGGDHLLEPGGDHVMLMGVVDAIQPGAVVTVELELADGSVLTVEAPAKEFAGAQEEYDPEADEMDEHDMADMDDMGEHDMAGADGEDG